jgi:hypothetical protein
MTMGTPSLLEGLPAVSGILGGWIEKVEVVPLDADLTAYVVARPGETLNRSVHRRIYSALVPVTTRSFAADMTPYWAQRSKEGYLERLAEFVMVADPEGAMVGWTGFHILPYDEVTLVYLDSTGMIPEWQSRGLMRKLMRARVHGAVLPSCPTDRPVYLSARSESPVFYRLMRSLLDTHELFPHPTLPVSTDVAKCGALLAEWLGQRDLFNTSTLAIQGAYGALDELYGELPATGDTDLDKLFRDRLGPLDAYLLIGRAR